MSASASFGSPAPTDRDLSIVPELRQYVVPPPQVWVWRIHSLNTTTGEPHPPVYFSNSASSRWDFQAQSSGVAVPDVDGVLCVGATFTAALVEIFARRWPSVLPKRGAPPRPYAHRRVLAQDDITQKFATRLRLPSTLRLFDLTKPGALSSIEIDAELTTTKNYAATRPWARWFFQCRDIDGLIYSSRPGGAALINYALFNRAGLKESLEETAGNARPLALWEQRLAEACQAFNVIVLPPPIPPAP